jgi:hypothetical protein
VRTVLHSLRRYNNPGSDRVEVQLLQCPALLPALTLRMNLVLDTGHISNPWRESVIVPAYKKDDASTASNYRSTALMQAQLKLFNKLLLMRLRPYVDYRPSRDELLDAEIAPPLANKKKRRSSPPSSACKVARREGGGKLSAAAFAKTGAVWSRS